MKIIFLVMVFACVTKAGKEERYVKEICFAGLEKYLERNIIDTKTCYEEVRGRYEGAIGLFKRHISTFRENADKLLKNQDIENAQKTASYFYYVAKALIDYQEQLWERLSKNNLEGAFRSVKNAQGQVYMHYIHYSELRDGLNEKFPYYEIFVYFLTLFHEEVVKYVKELEQEFKDCMKKKGHKH